MTTTPMNLRLAMAAWSVTHDEDEKWYDAPAIEKHPYMLEVDAILAELEQPSEGMKQAAMNLDAVKALGGMVTMAFVHGTRLPAGEPPLWQAYRAMIRHILDET